MILRRFGLELIRLTLEDLELLRNWRNDSEISRFMIFRGHITPEEQQEWFRRIDPKNDYYFIISVNGTKIGLADVKKINWKEKSTEGGLFVLPQYRQTDIPFRASLSGNDFAFFELGLNFFLARVLKGNVRALRYNRGLGYVVVSDNPDEDFITMKLTRDAYLSKTDHLRRYLQKIYP